MVAIKSEVAITSTGTVAVRCGDVCEHVSRSVLELTNYDKPEENGALDAVTIVPRTR